ncbi:hypothetical protein FFLO_06908 [Filobasidium floriforme]|uniref:Major facilitator superfamily (MFS) profile domain-containing protein n=1 Tax=Filobasidium floriforme TaxID=5210 RepID=A0A8K0JDY1_9TREE|nr:hypothetical protein FFLO_06908 [Filobasidium floriforme]
MSSAFMIGPVFIQMFSTSRGMLLAGKMLGGIPQGIFVVSTANYISESATVKMRAPTSALMAMTLVLGIVFGLTVGYERFLYFDSAWKSWRLVLSLQLIFPVLTITGLFFTTDSPVYQVKRDQVGPARRSLMKLYGKDSPDLAARLASIQLAVALERDAQAHLAPARWIDLFRDPVDRRRTLIACTIWLVYQAGGNAFTANGLYFLNQVGIQIDVVFKITITMLALSAVTNLFAGYALERFGRRACFVYANVFHLVVLLVIGGLGFVDYHSAGGLALAILINLAISTQQFATAGPTYALMNELSSLRLRAKTQSLALGINALVGWAFTFVTPYLFQPDSADLGAKTAFIFAGLTAIGIVWSYFYVPETVGRSTIEIDSLFSRSVPARLFRRTDVSSLSSDVVG